jgi:hypothetical protein
VSLFDDVPMPQSVTALPVDGTFTLTCPVLVTAQDLQRFLEAGGSIEQAGFRLFIDDPTKIVASNIVAASLARMDGAHPDGNGGSGSGVVVREVERNTPLRTGDVVYRVVEVDPAPMLPGPHTWKAVSRVVERASAKQIKLKTAFPGYDRVLFDPSAFGRAFFETPLQAIQHFLAERRLEIDALDRKRKEAARAITWAETQEGVK